MREINESWRVLQDADRRRAYDDERLREARRPHTTAPSSPGTAGRASVPAAVDDDDLVDVLPPMTGLTAGLFRHLPWVVLVVVFGAIFILSAYAGGRSSGSSEVTPTAASVRAGTCVDVLSGPTTTVVSCDGPHELEIVDRVDEATACPPGTERRRLGTDGLLDCVVEG